MFYSSIYVLLAESVAEGAAKVADSPRVDWTILLFFAGVIGIMILMPRLIRRSTRERRALEKQYTREVDNRVEVKRETDRIMLELVEAGREINAQIDTKMRVLNRLVKDAEAVCQRLENAVGNTGPSEVEPVGGAAAGVRQDKLTAVVSYREEQPQESKEPEPPLQKEVNGLRTESGRFKVDIRERILRQYEQGREIDEIARLLRLSTAEVNLVIDMAGVRRQE